MNGTTNTTTNGEDEHGNLTPVKEHQKSERSLESAESAKQKRNFCFKVFSPFGENMDPLTSHQLYVYLFIVGRGFATEQMSAGCQLKTVIVCVL